MPFDDLVAEHILPLARPRQTDWDGRLRVPARIERLLSAMDDHSRLCADAINRGGFDILLAHPCMSFRVTAIGRHVRGPRALYLQEPFRALYEAQPRLPWLAPAPSNQPPFSLARLREKALDRRRLHNARLQGREELGNAVAFDQILVNSLFSRESVLRAYALDSEVCYLGTDLTRFTHRGAPRERLVVGLGSYTPEKNLRLVIEALALLPEPRPHLAWIGNFDYDDMIRTMTGLAQQRGVPFTAYLRIPDDELVSLLNRATAMVYAPRLEPFGLAPIEAGACGLPVVAVAEGGVRETVIDGQTGILVKSDAQAVADAVARLLADPALVQRIGATARANSVRHWSVEAATDRIERALLRVAAARPRT